MARFDVYRNANKATAEDFPYLLDVQADLFTDLRSRVVVPLMAQAAVAKPMSRLNPVFTVQGKKVVMATTDLAGVPVSALGDKAATLAGESSVIIGAIDFLLTGV
jgi:toxin CcdB